MLLYRFMTEHPDGMPLFVRESRALSSSFEAPIQEDGTIHRSVGGVCVSPNSPQRLPPHRRPPMHRGTGTGPDPIWEIDSGDLPPTLSIDPTINNQRSVGSSSQRGQSRSGTTKTRF
jgi:hypothetical protein